MVPRPIANYTPTSPDDEIINGGEYILVGSDLIYEGGSSRE